MRGEIIPIVAGAISVRHHARHAAQQKQRTKQADNRRVRSDHNVANELHGVCVEKAARVLHDHLEQTVHTPTRGKTVVDSRAHARRKDKRAHKDVYYRCDKTKSSAAGHSRQRHDIGD